MRTFQKLVIYMLLGIGVGNLLNLIFSMAYGEFSPGKPIFIESFSNVNTAVLVETIVFAVLGLLQGLASNIFQSKLNDNIKYGNFIQITIDFLITAIAIFIFVKAINTAKDKMSKEEETEEKAPEVDAKEELLKEIRDLLKK